ncbi:MAG: hypothetical protein KC473_07285, partial [Candidatus Dadabacteria bacterium]|nr:hypothetical protein [Candidatus Dadabacteria bacterium]
MKNIEALIPSGDNTPFPDRLRGITDMLGSEASASVRTAGIIEKVLSGETINREDALTIAGLGNDELPYILLAASEMRDRGKGRVLTFSRNVFVPLTQLCRNHCGYCTFK